MKKNRTWVALAENEWGQVVDGLICRAELYEETVRYYESGPATWRSSIAASFVKLKKPGRRISGPARERIAERSDKR